MIGLDLLGASGEADVVKAPAEGVASVVREDHVGPAGGAQADEQIRAAITTDRAAAAALSRALVAQEIARLDPKRAVEAKKARAEAEGALRAQWQATTKLTPAGHKLQVEAAERAVEAAEERAASRKGAQRQVAQFGLVAARRILDRARRGPRAQAATSSSPEGVLTRKIVGPIRVWHAIAGFIAAAAGGTLLLLSRRKT